MTQAAMIAGVLNLTMNRACDMTGATDVFDKHSTTKIQDWQNKMLRLITNINLVDKVMEKVGGSVIGDLSDACDKSGSVLEGLPFSSFGKK